MGVQEILRNQKFGKAVFMLHGIALFNCIFFALFYRKQKVFL